MLKLSMKLTRILVLFTVCCLLFAANPIFGQEPTTIPAFPPSSLEKFQQNLKNCDEFGTTSMECWIGGPEQVSEKPQAATGVMPAVANSLTTMILGKIPTQEELQQPQSYRPGGAIGGITNLIAAMYARPPASSVEYFADLGRNLGIVKPAYAQGGVGFQGLTPILPLWKAFRNIAYLFFTIVFVIIGFAIMFRVKLDPQTVISIQNAIPRIVVALILVTFSYAIAGLLIDLIYILISLGIMGLGSFGAISLTKATDLQNQYIKSDLLGTMLMFSGKAWTVIKNAPGAGPILAVGIIAFVIQLLISIAAIVVTGGAALPVVTGLQAILGPVVGGVTSGMIMIILALLFIIIGYLTKILLMLVKAYVSIIFLIIFGPLLLTVDAFPSKGEGARGWFFNLLANISVFPVVVMICVIADLLMETVSSKQMWGPPLVGSSTSILTFAIGLGTLMLIPNVADLIQQWIGAKALPFGTGVSFEPLTREGWPKFQEQFGKGVSKGWKALKPYAAKRLSPELVRALWGP